MKIVDFTKEKNKFTILSKDKNNREINIFLMEDLQLIGDNLFYPNILGFSHKTNKIYSLIKEKIMSLKKLKKNKNFKIDCSNINIKEKYDEPLFYFIYNTDNYYHFIYDTLPYLISYINLKNNIPNLKLLMSYSLTKPNSFYNFVKEFLEILDINEKDIVIAKPNCLYKKIYISNSYTHDLDSNLPPRKEIYSFYRMIVEKVKLKYKIKNLPKKIYISRRTWIHNDLSNIGTNYTTRRKLINEDELVKSLKKIGYKEIFTENLSTIEKILIFDNADYIVGAIGGGVCNVLFSSKKTNLSVLISPTFLDINKRFIFSFKNVKTKFFKSGKHIELGKWKLYMRVKSGNIIGEIEKIFDDDLMVSYTNHFVSGWNSKIKLKKSRFKKNKCIPLDNGLNSPWIIDINKFLKFIKKD